jgi:hypothetical protein
MDMIKRILVVALLASMLALVKPAPAAAHVGFSFVIGLPFFRAGIDLGVPGPYYGPPGYPAYAPSAYGAAPVYFPAPVYGARPVYAPRRVFVPAYRGYATRTYYRPRVETRRFRRW